MSWKQIVKRSIPPLMLELYHQYQHGIRPGYIWEGIYSHYKDVPTKGKGFEGETWNQMIRSSMQRVMDGYKTDSSLPPGVVGEYSLLPFLSSIIVNEAHRVKVLDFGGGAGETYIHLLHALGKSNSVDYHVVETQQVCEIGRNFFQLDDHIRFHPTLPDHPFEVDVIYLGSVLQYIEDYPGLLRKLCTYRPKYFLFVKLSAGDIPTYATAQRNVAGSIIPYWFINIEELVKIMDDNNYSLIFKGIIEREYDQDNFPQDYRLKQTCNVLFATSS